MDTEKSTGGTGPKATLSALWIFAVLNYLYADVFNLFFDPAARVPMAIPQGGVLVFAILMETAIAMTLLSRFLSHGANRWANIIAGLFHTGFVAWSMTGQTPTIYYIFFASVEMVCTLFIAWYAWKWTEREPHTEPSYTRRAT